MGLFCDETVEDLFMYSLLKFHKLVYAISTVVSHVPAPAVKLSRILINAIKATCNFDVKYSFKNSYDSTQKNW